MEEIDPKELTGRLFGQHAEYLSFLNTKRGRPVYDLYAAFQPFNESTQCLFPLVPLLREHLKPGDLILDLWCRTGWSGELLASLFPDQQVISLWEGASGLLGYKGFDFWLGTGVRRHNLDIVFHSPNNPLPFATGAFAVVHGLDTFHRYHHVPMISETFRVVATDGILLFPHNHLTNSQPEPYFDRGEDQLHSREYRRYFDRLLNQSDRRAYILSEKTLFDVEGEYRLKDETDTKHYNACLLIAGHDQQNRLFRTPSKEFSDHANAHVIVNPLWNIDLTKGLAVPAPEVMDHGGETLFFRHPMYEARLERHSPIRLDEPDKLIVYWALRLKNVSEIAAALSLDPALVLQRLLRMESKELVQLQNVSQGMAQLQSFYSSQEVPPVGQNASLISLWKGTMALHQDRPFLIWPVDDSIFTYGDVDRIVRMTASYLTAHGVQPGDKVMIDAVSHPEFMFLFWGIVLLGAVAVPVNPEMRPAAYAAVLARTQPRIVFCDPSLRDAGPNEFPRISFAVPEDSSAFRGSFSEQVADAEPRDEFQACDETAPAVVLFTSGSTGDPKGVVLSHGALFRTSRILDQAYGWKSEDCFLGGGSFHTMSGLRNPCIAVLHSGASVVIPGKENSQNPMSTMSLCLKHQVTILNVTPAFLAYWNAASRKSAYFQSHGLRMVLTTGAALHPGHRQAFESLFRVPVFDYYGLTETTGACILETSEIKNVAEKGIGKPRGCLVKIVGDSGDALPVGETGELAIYSENLMLGYLGEDALTRLRIRDGWLFTADLARINQDGCVVLGGRKDRMLVDKNGENFYPEEVEQALCASSDVMDAYVAQWRDEAEMDHIAALVQFRAEGDIPRLLAELRAAMSARIPVLHIPSLLLPVAEMPRGASGKVSVEAARQLFAAALKTS